MPQNPVVPPLASPPFRDPVALEQPDQGNPLAPRGAPPFNASWQRWIGQLYRAVAALLGTNPSTVLLAAGVQYRWKTGLRIAVPQSALGALQGILGPNDMGLLVEVTDYNHVLEWDGAVFGWAPGDSGSNWSAPGTPSAVGWVQCVGAPVQYLMADGTLGGVVLPNTPDLWFRQ